MKTSIADNIGHLIAALFLAAGAAAIYAPRASAQDLNPTVEVTNAYESGHIEANKPLMEMAVPDSVLNFRLDFDYSISPKPYRGSYDFSPYVVDVQPESYSETAKTLFLRVGAGYSLHPTVDIVYTPRFKTRSFSMSVYGTHRSYFGKYRAISASSGDDALRLDWDRDSKFSGYSSYTSAGVYGRADWDTGLFSFDVGYTGYARRDTSFKRTFDMFRAQLRVASRRRAERHFFYDISASYLYGSDAAKTVGTVCPIPCSDGRAHLAEHDISVAATLGPVFSEQSRFLFDVRFDLSEYSSFLDSYSGKFVVNPKYIVKKNRWFVNLGAAISIPMGADHTVWTPVGGGLIAGEGTDPTAGEALSYASASMHGRKSQYVYPDVEIGFDVVRSHLNIYLKATGGDEINRYSDMVRRNPCLSLNWAWNYAGLQLLDNTVEKYNARFGLRGSIASRLSYDFYAGYANYKGLPLDAVVASADYTALAPAVSYVDCRYRYVTLDLGWHSRSVTADGSVSCVSTNLSKYIYTGFAPDALRGSFNIVYNWRKRIYVGIHGDGVSSRTGSLAVMALTQTSTSEDVIDSYASLVTGSDAKIPGWFDLGLSAEYRFSRTLSVWAYGSNLLHQTIMPVPLYCTSGIAVTAGITLVL